MIAVQLTACEGEKAIRRNCAADQFHAQMREHVSRKFYSMREAIAAGDEVAIREAEQSMREYFDSGDHLGHIVRVALTQGPEETQKEVLLAIGNVLRADAQQAAERELSLQA